MSLMLQDIVVTLFSIGAAATLVARLVTLIRPRRGRSACNSCNACAPSASKPQRSSPS